jgi:hypothetical protein
MHPLEALDLQYLAAELARLDLLLQREVRRWVLAGQDPNDDYRGLYIAQTEAAALVARPFGTSWGQSIALPPDEAAAYTAALAHAAAQIAAAAAACRAAGAAPRLLQLAQDFALDRTALDILLLCIAPAFDTKYERLYGYLQDNVTRRRPAVRLVLDLLGEPGSAKFALAPYLSAAGPLCRHGLVERSSEPPPANESWLYQALAADETVIAWLRGSYEPAGWLQGCAALNTSPPDAAARLLVADLLDELPPPEHDAGPGQRAPILALYGPDRTRQDAAAQVLAARAGCPLLTVTLPAVLTEGASLAAVVGAALRDARLTGACVYLRPWHVCLDEDGRVAPGVLADLFAHPGPVILASATTWQPHATPRTRAIRWLETPSPGYQQRRRLWQHYIQAAALPPAGAAAIDAAAIDAAAIDALAGQFALTSGGIGDAVSAAYDAAAGQPLALAHLRAGARACSTARLHTLARKITPRFQWQDIVLPANQTAILRELVATVRQRQRVLNEWGVGQKLAASAGVTALFAGPPGAGKTMAAEVVALDLGLDLYKIDLAAVVSKYIGETEKNLERIFSEAADSNAILFFDEADAIFGKRSEIKDAHDRYANVEVSYLLQRIEAYDGITILATNLRANLDEAFTRRLHYVVDFPFPRVEDRRRIWAALFPPTLPRAADLDFDLLAQRYELAGGSIRNVIVAAAYLAADNGQIVTMDHLLHGVKRELQKMGRSLGDKGFAS